LDGREGLAKEITMFGSLGLPELLVILLIVIIIFGANKLPQLGKGLGQGLKNFKDSVKGDEPPSDKPKS
jgi:sec-independent protein translocase protein TatA